MSNTTKSRFLRNRTLSRFAALGGSAIIVGSLLLTVAVTTASAAGTGAKFPTTTENPTGTWTTPNGAFADGGATANARPANGGSMSQGYGTFGFSIPGGSIIDGISVDIEASSTDSSGCSLEVGLSGSGGSNLRTKTISNVASALTLYTLGGASDTWGQVWDPTQLSTGNFRVQLRAIDGSSCNDSDANSDQSTFAVDYFTVTITYRTINDGTKNAAVDTSVCDKADFNFVIDMSGSIGAQGSAPSNLPAMQAGINSFVNTFQASGDGLYSGTKFNGDIGAVAMTAGYQSAATFKAAVGPPPGLSGPSGLTPTSAGIASAAGNTANDRAGVQNIMFVLTDGSPNVPPGSPLDSPPTWLTAANAAIAAANAARSSYIVKAVYLSAPGDPGDTTLPFTNPDGDALWASSVMTQIGGGSYLPADFGSFAQDLLNSIHCNPDLQVKKTAANTPINAGETASFTIELKNIGKGTATSAKLSDPLPAGVSWTIAPPVTGCSITTGTLNCDFGMLASDAVKTVTVTGVTDKADCGTLPNTASATATNEPQNVLGNNHDSATITVICADLDLTKTADAAAVDAGQQIGFTVKLENKGAGTATGVVFSDPLPAGAGVSWSLAAPSTGWSVTGSAPNQSLVYSPTTLAGNTSTSAHVVSATTKDSCKAYVNSASVSSGNDGGDQASATTTVNCASLDLTKTADAASVSAGSQIGFTVKIENTGAGGATGIAFTDNLPGGPGVSWSINPANANWSITGVAPSQVLNFIPTTLAGKASSTVHIVSNTTSASCKAYPNSASVTTGNDGGDQASATTTVTCPSLDVTKVADAASVSAGSQIGFTVTLANNGDGTAADLVFADALPGGTGINWSISPASAGWQITGSAPNQSLIYIPSTLAGHTSTSVHVVSNTTGTSCGSYPNSASVTASNGAGDQAQASTKVDCPALDLTKVADAESVSAGSPIGFTVTLANDGDGTATGLAFSDALPGGDGVNWSVSPASAGWSIGGVAPNQTLVYSPTTLAGHSSTSVHVVSNTSGASCGDYPNNASVTAGNAGGDKAFASTTVNCADIQISKVADDDSVSAGDAIGFTITVTNNGAGSATGVHVADVLPTDAGLSWTAGAVFGPNAAGASCAIATGSLTCDAASLPSGGSFSVHISSPTTGATVADSPVENSATVTTTNDGSDESSDQVEVLGAHIAIDKEADDAVVNAGETIGFSVTISNSGPGQAKGVEVSDTLPTDGGLNWSLDDNAGGLCALDSGVVTCEKATLDAGDSFSFHVTSTTTAATADDSPVQNEACVSTSNDGQDCDTDQTEVLGADITIAKSADEDSVGVGDSIGFTVTVSNDGKGQAKGVHVTDTLPTDAGLSWILDDNADGLCELEAGVVTCDKDALDSGGSFSFHVTSTTTAETAKDSPVENEACVTTTNDGQACAGDEVGVSSLIIDKSNNAPIDEALGLPEAPVGSTVTYTLDYTFTGDPVTNGVIHDVLPEGVDYQAGTATNNDEFTFEAYDSSTRTLTWLAATVTKSGTLQYKVTVLEEAEGFGPLTNVATIQSDQTGVDDATSDIFVPTTPEAETSKPTPPQTDVFDGSGQMSGPGSSLLLMFLILGGLIVGLAFITPVPEVVRRRNRR